MPAPWVLLALAAAFACNRPQAAPRAQPTPAAAELDARHACLAPERPSAAIRLAPVFDGLETKAPVALVQAPQLAGEASGRWFVVDQRGYARSFYATDKGRVLIKNFSRSGPLFETRFYVRHADGEYSGYSYAWLEDGKDARLVQETEVRKVQGSTWIFPGMDACNQCHTAAAGRTLGSNARSSTCLRPEARSSLASKKRAS